MSKLIINCETGEIKDRELNKAEKDQQIIDEAKIESMQAEIAIKEAARAALLDKLGITADEAKLLLG